MGDAGHHLYNDNPLDCVKSILGFQYGKEAIIKFEDSFELRKVRNALYEICLGQDGICKCNHMGIVANILGFLYGQEDAIEFLLDRPEDRHFEENILEYNQD